VGVVFDEAVNEFSEIETTGHVPETGTELEEVFTDFGLGDDVEVASKGDLQLAVTEEFKVAGFFADGAADAFGDGVKFAFGGGEEGEDTVGFAEVAAFEDDGFDGVAMLLSHNGCVLQNRELGR